MPAMAKSDVDLYDVVFIDAAKSHYREFWDMALPMCRQSALIICDNVLMKGMTASDIYDTNKRYKTSIRKMREFIKYINHLEYADTCVLPVGDGVSVSVIDKDIYDGWKISSKQTLPDGDDHDQQETGKVEANAANKENGTFSSCGRP